MSIDRAVVLSAIRSVLVYHLEVPIASLNEQVILSDIGIDIPDAIDAIMAIEDELNVELPDDLITISTTIASLCDSILSVISSNNLEPSL